MTDLKISAQLSLPTDVAGEAIAILAKRGAGKTNTATVLVEELYNAGIQVVILDPVGAWWGVRSSADGEHEGLKIAVLGGVHGDVELDQAAGALIADVAVDTGQSLLIDLSDFPSKAAMSRFVVDFAERLFRRKNRDKTLIHLVLEEADTFAPQAGKGDDARMRGAIEQIVRRGRSRGLGLTMVTQRSAVLNKDVLSQADVLIAMRTTSPHDTAAIKLWVSAHGDDEHGVIASLPALETGEAWVWNPERGLLDRIHVRARRTFDSSATPKAGEQRAEPKRLAEFDVTTLGEQIKATAERAKANDPAALKRRVDELERDLAARPSTTETIEIRVPVEVPVLSDELVQRLAFEVEDMLRIVETIAPLQAAIDQIQEALRAARQSEQPQPAPTRPASRPAPAARPAPPQTPAATGDLSAYAHGLLETLAQRHPMRLTRAQISTFSGRKPRSSAFSAAISTLAKNGLVDVDRGEVRASDTLFQGSTA
jgi:uncharacterized protein